MKTTRAEQRELEMARGREVGSRAARSVLLSQYENTKGVIRTYEGPYDSKAAQRPERFARWIVDGVEVWRQPEAECWVNDWPSEAMMATLALAINATLGMDSVPAPEPTHPVSEGGKEYAKRLREANKDRWK